MSLVEYAKSELERAGYYDDEDGFGPMMAEAVLKLIEVFADEGHSGGSAPIAIALFEKLARFEPLTPLTGADDEWTDVSEFFGEPCWQNKRCPRVFKGADGRAYDIRAVIFEGPDGMRYASRDSRRYIAFPYVPKTEVVKVAAAA